MQEPSPLLRWLANATATALNAAVLGFFVVLGLFYSFSRDLPDPARLAKYEPPIITRLYAGDGRLMAEYASEHRIYLPLEAIPKRIIDAVLSAEDKNFYEHSGIDYMSLVRAVVTNINNLSTGKSPVGGSTITQQVVKNFLLSNEKSLERKVKEAILAFRIDRIYSKDRILELYLNQIYLGRGSYGVAAAALNYFNKSLDELTVAEAAFLAGLPKAPSNYNPDHNYDQAKARRDYVIGRMREDRHITREEAEMASKSPITLRDRDKTEAVDAPFFAEEVRRRLAAMYGSDVLYKGGLFVKTTLDAQLQEYADIALRQTLVEYDRRHGFHGPVATLPNLTDWKKKLEELALTTPLYDDQDIAVVESLGTSAAEIMPLKGKKGFIPIEHLRWARRFMAENMVGPAIAQPKDVLMVGDVVVIAPEKDKKGHAVSRRYKLEQIPKVNGGLLVMNPHTGRILAITGGYSPLGTQFNRATQARRQPGSAFKPFVYLAGLEAGYTPASILWDSPISLPQGAGLPNWSPKNYSNDFLGPVPFRIGVEKSRNAMTVYLASRLGIKRIRDIGKRMGIYDDMPAEYSAVLGSRETTLLKLVNAYAMLVNGGKKLDASPIERIDDRYGKTIYRRDERLCKKCEFRTVPEERALKRTPPAIIDNREAVIDSATAYQMVSILQGVVERGTAVRAQSLGLPLGGKTGTTNESRDTWFIGFSPDLVVGLYVGYDQPKSLGEKETGSSVALPGFIKFMELAAKGKPSRAFTIPKGIQLVKIDRWSGRPTAGGYGPNTILEAFKVQPTALQTTAPQPDGSAAAAPSATGEMPLPAIAPAPAPAAAEPVPPPTITFGEDEQPQEVITEEDGPASAIPTQAPSRRMRQKNPYLNRRHPMYHPNQGTGGIY